MEEKKNINAEPINDNEMDKASGGKIGIFETDSVFDKEYYDPVRHCAFPTCGELFEVKSKNDKNQYCPKCRQRIKELQKINKPIIW